MQTYDIIMLVVVGAAVLFGAWKGLAWQVASFASIFASYFVANNFRGLVAAQFEIHPLAAMLILFLGTSLAVWIAFQLLKTGLDKAKLKDFDRHAGALLGAAKGLVLCVLITMFAVALLGDNARRSIADSHSGRALVRVIDHAEAVMPKEVREVLQPYLTNLDKNLGQGGAEPNSELFSHDGPPFAPEAAMDAGLGGAFDPARDFNAGGDGLGGAIERFGERYFSERQGDQPPPAFNNLPTLEEVQQAADKFQRSARAIQETTQALRDIANGFQSEDEPPQP